MTKFNFVDDYSGLYRSDIDNNDYDIDSYPVLWTFLNESTTPRIDAVTYRHASRLSVELRNPITESYSFESVSFEIPADQALKEFSFNAVLRCNAPANVTIYLFDSGELFSSVEPVTTQISASEWTACFSNIFAFVDKNRPVYGLKVRVVISEHQGKIVHFSMPNLVNDKIFMDSTYYNPALRFFPDIYKEIDAEQTSPTYPFFKLWHSLTGVADSVMKEYIDIFSYQQNEIPVSIKSQEFSSNYNGFLSKLTNPEVMPNAYTQWASMFIGKLIKNGIYITEDVTINSPIVYNIGDIGPGGGEIFITPDTAGNNTGKYFEVLNSTAYLMWTDYANISTSVPGANSIAIGGGFGNTAAIFALGPSEDYTIETFLSSFSYGGYSDWFVPSVGELQALYNVKDDLAMNFDIGIYFSSTGQFPDVAEGVGFPDGMQFSSVAKDSVQGVVAVRMFDGSVPVTIPGTVQQEVLPDSLEFRRKQLSTRMYGFSAGTKSSIKNAARTVIGEDAAVVITPNWNNDQWSIMVRTVTASTPGVSGSGQFSPEVYQVMEPAKPAGYTLLHSTLDEITFVLDDNDFGVFNQSVIG